MGTCCSVEEGGAEATSRGSRAVKEAEEDKKSRNRKLKKYEANSTASATTERTPTMGPGGASSESLEMPSQQQKHGSSISSCIDKQQQQQQENGDRSSSNNDVVVVLPLGTSLGTSSANTHGVTRETSRQSSYAEGGAIQEEHHHHLATTTAAATLPNPATKSLNQSQKLPSKDDDHHSRVVAISSGRAALIDDTTPLEDAATSTGGRPRNNNNNNSSNSNHGSSSVVSSHRSGGVVNGGGGFSNSSAVLGLSGNSPLIALDHVINLSSPLAAGSSSATLPPEEGPARHNNTTNINRNASLATGGSGGRSQSLSGVNPSTVGYLPEPQTHGMLRVLAESNLPQEQRFLDRTQQQQQQAGMMTAGAAAAGSSGGTMGNNYRSSGTNARKSHLNHDHLSAAPTTATGGAAVGGGGGASTSVENLSINNLSLGRDAGLHSVGYFAREPSNNELQERIKSVALRTELMEAMEASINSSEDEFREQGKPNVDNNFSAAARHHREEEREVNRGAGGGNMTISVSRPTPHDKFLIDDDEEEDAAGFVSSGGRVSSGAGAVMGGMMHIRDEDQVLSSSEEEEEEAPARDYYQHSATDFDHRRNISLLAAKERKSVTEMQRALGIGENSPALVGNHLGSHNAGVFNFSSPTTGGGGGGGFDMDGEEDDPEGFVSTGGSYSPDFYPAPAAQNFSNQGRGAPLQQQQYHDHHHTAAGFVRSDGSSQPQSSAEETPRRRVSTMGKTTAAQQHAKKKKQQREQHLERLETGSATSSHAVDGRQVQVLVNGSQARTSGNRKSARGGKAGGGNSTSRDTVVVPQNPRDAALQQAAMDRYAREAIIKNSSSNTLLQQPQTQRQQHTIPSAGPPPHAHPHSSPLTLENLMLAPSGGEEGGDGSGGVMAVEVKGGPSRSGGVEIGRAVAEVEGVDVVAAEDKISAWLRGSSRASGGVKILSSTTTTDTDGK